MRQKHFDFRLQFELPWVPIQSDRFVWNDWPFALSIQTKSLIKLKVYGVHSHLCRKFSMVHTGFFTCIDIDQFRCRIIHHIRSREPNGHWFESYTISNLFKPVTHYHFMRRTNLLNSYGFLLKIKNHGPCILKVTFLWYKSYRTGRLCIGTKIAFRRLSSLVLLSPIIARSSSVHTSASV